MFISFEGIEGSSKSTQAGLLSEWLKDQGIDHLLTKEPGSVISKECQQIRHLLLSPDNDLGSRTELLLYLADRAQHVDKCIKPALDAGQWIISDRYSFSTYVYQGVGRGLLTQMPDLFTDMLQYAQYNLMPDLIFVMDLPAEVGLVRAKSSNTEFEGGDRIERETLDFHKQLRQGFLRLADKYQDICVLMNAEKTIEELHEEVKQVLSKHMNG